LKPTAIEAPGAGNIAIEGYIKELLKYLQTIEHLPPEQRLKLLELKLNSDQRAAATGWL
jgi:aromatic ring hydroxylase